MAILFLGDFLYDYDKLETDMKKISDWIKKNNYRVILNLEGPITSDFSQKIKKRGPNLYQHKKVIDILKELQVVGVCLANNHMMDYGNNGLVETIEILDKNNILHTGAGRNIYEASIPMVIIDGQYTYEIYNFGWNLEETVYAGTDVMGCSPREKGHVLNCIDKKNDNSYIKVAIMHWGFEFNHLPMPYDIELAHEMADKGCNIIIGHHPHVLQPVEKYKDTLIYYSVGNFYMGTRRQGYLDKLKDNRLGMGVVIVGKEEKEKCDILYSQNETQILSSTFDKDITGVDYLSTMYVKKCKKNSQNYTPILTNNILMNNIKIIPLNLFYAIYGKIRYLRKKKGNN